MADFGSLELSEVPKTQIMRIPALLLCYWMGQSELDGISTKP